MSAVSSFSTSVLSGTPAASVTGFNDLRFSTQSYTNPRTTETYILSWSTKAIATVRVRPDSDGGGLLLQNGATLAPNASPTTVNSAIISINPTPRQILYRAIESNAGGKGTTTTRSGSAPTATGGSGGTVSSSSKKRKKKSKFGGGAIAGVILGVLATIATILAAVLVVLKRKKKAKEEIARGEDDEVPKHESDRMLAHGNETPHPINPAYSDAPTHSGAQEPGAATVSPGKKEISEPRA
ncbi:hypothetical protein FB567DRAFT_513022 [Paraphoma chrysanthemicola]|uniref:Mid2 domain-containing protein n=1 Tax=Paraphoma chrysanthemicola TaxID=798071 RepID=A0A8K0RLZ9_9PLEO|nr:hypothetical protein FB567DRAFT_513022 [Paraphoma chrysanthemicola]